MARGPRNAADEVLAPHNPLGEHPEDCRRCAGMMTAAPSAPARRPRLRLAPQVIDLPQHRRDESGLDRLREGAFGEAVPADHHREEPCEVEHGRLSEHPAVIPKAPSLRRLRPRGPIEVGAHPAVAISHLKEPGGEFRGRELGIVKLPGSTSFPPCQFPKSASCASTAGSRDASPSSSGSADSSRPSVKARVLPCHRLAGLRGGASRRYRRHPLHDRTGPEHTVLEEVRLPLSVHDRPSRGPAVGFAQPETTARPGQRSPGVRSAKGAIAGALRPGLPGASRNDQDVGRNLSALAKPDQSVTA